MEEIFARVSVRDFLDRRVEPEKVEMLMRAGMAAPSARNQQCWEFVVVSDRGTVERLSHVSAYAHPAAGAPMVIAVLGNANSMPSPLHWEQDLGAATENILLEAVHLGLGAVWLGIAPVKERMDSVGDILELPAYVRPYALIAVGYPKKSPAAHDRYDPEKVHWEKY